MSHAECFRRVPIFSGLSAAELEALAAAARPRRFGAGETVFQAGDRGAHLYVVASGLVKVTRTTPEGREQVVRLLGPGEFYGEVALFASHPLPATGVALHPSEVCLLDRPGVEQLLQRSPAAGVKMLQALSQRVAELEALVEQLAVYPVEARVAALLVKLARAAGAGPVVTLPLTQEELARLVGTTQETLSRRLHSLAQDGLIVLEGRRRVRVLDMPGLVMRAGEVAE